MIRIIFAIAALLISTQAHAERCALIESGSIKRFEVFAACPPNPAAKPQFKWLPAPIGAPPEFDPITQIRTGPSYSVGASSVTESWSITTKTAGQLDADKFEKIDSISTAMFRAICNHENRIRVLEAKSVLTLAQCRDGLKALLP